MMKKMIAFLIVASLVYSPHIHAQDQKIEVFNIEKGKVIKDIPLTSSIQTEVEKYLTGINGLYKKINPLPQKGLIVRVPLNPSLQVQNQWIHTLVDEMTIIIPLGEDPYLMIYDDENNTYFFTVKSNMNTSRLFKHFGITMKKGVTH